MAHRLAAEAEADLHELWYYVASESSIEVADRLVDSLATRFFLLGTHPRAGRRRDDLWPGIRVFHVGDYIVLYRVEGNDVLIVRVVRGSRDLEALLRD
jgi:toxin ParE1/3/4